MALATTSEQGRHLILPMPNTAFRFNDVAAQLFSENPSDELTSCKASLNGKLMPTLEWPDSVGGPWSSASKPTRLLDERRRNAIARWLQEESDDDDDIETSGANMNLSSLPARHPMIAKVVMDRKRKELMLVSALSTPSLTNSSGGGTTKSSSLSSSSTRNQSSSSHRRRRRRQHRTADDADIVAESPSARRHKLRKLHHDHHQQQQSALELPVTPSRTSKTTTKERNGKRRSKKALSRTASSTDSFHTAHIGCQCGITAAEDKSTPMIQCNGCTSWYHLSCIGFGSAAEAPTEEENWFCFMCCEMASAMLTPSSLSSGLSVTPIFPRSAVLAGQQVRLSQGQLPVFAQPIETPSHHHRDEGHAHAFSSALALAPSPIVHSGSSLDSLHRGAATSSVAAGRARASRVGWHLAEPGSPLQHKGIAASTAGGVVVSSMPFNSPSGRQWRSSFNGELGGGARLMTASHIADEYGNGGNVGVHGTSNDSTIVRAAAEAYLRTPSPRLSAATFTPTTIRRTRQSSGNVGLRSAMAAATAASGMTFGGHHRRESSKAVAAARDFDDIFSTPSRILTGSASWGQSADGTVGLRHSRQPSLATSMAAAAANQGTTPWGLSTPTRHLMDAGFQSDYSAGALPSLVHSSADLDMGEFAGWHHPLQMSPSSNTRAASRARQQSTNGRRTSSVRHPMTPERSVGGFDAASSSPFPKTPTFDVYHQRHRFGSSAALEDDQDGHGHLDLLTADDFDVMDEASDMPFDMRYNVNLKSRNSLSANRRMSSLSHAAAVRSPSILSPNTSHTRTFAATKNSSKANNALQGALDMKTGQRNGNAVNSVKSRSRKASNDTMTGLGIGLELNDVLEWAT